MSRDTVEIDGKCRWCQHWQGTCGAPADDSGFCVKHKAKKCQSCGKQATNGCGYCGQFVCGAPLCDDCEGYNDPKKDCGAWGFLNHSHRPKPAAKAARGAE